MKRRNLLKTLGAASTVTIFSMSASADDGDVSTKRLCSCVECDSGETANCDTWSCYNEC